MGRRRRRNPVSGVTFTDGRVRSVARGPASLIVRFESYDGSVLTMKFHGVVSQQVSEQALDFEVMSGVCDPIPEGWRLRLLDDDQEPLLQVTFKTAELRWGSEP